jgi:dipeptidyl-peptidase-4
VDPERIGVWGWSGGGFATCFALTHSDAFRAGIAVAPVTDWRFYDSIYTERYMGLPDEEPEAYRRTSALEEADRLSGRLLLMHGTSDDNVHPQNTIAMIDALIEAGKPYELQLYPGQTHSISGAKDRLHAFRMMEQFWIRELRDAAAAK